MPQTPTNLAEVFELFSGIIGSLLPIIVTATLLVFFWGLIKLIRGSADETAVKEGKELMKWGIIALFVMVSLWGIITLFTSDIFNTTPGIPQFPEGTNTSQPSTVIPEEQEEEERFLHGLTNEGYFDDGTPCPEYLFGTPSCAYDRNGTYQGQWIP